MKTSIIKISAESEITWHPLAEKLHQTFINCYDKSFLQELANYHEKQYGLIPQTIYLVANGTKAKNDNKKAKVANIVKNYCLVAGVFNPWFDINYLINPKSQKILICLSQGADESPEKFENKVEQFILADFYKAICTGNMSKIASSYSGFVKYVKDKNKQNVNFFTELTGKNLTAQNYANLLGVERDAIYKQSKKS